MPPEQLLQVLRAQPFVPFRLTITGNRTFDVHHPDQVIAGRTFAVIGIPATNDPQGFTERTVTVAMLHVTSLELLRAPAEPASP